MPKEITENKYIIFDRPFKFTLKSIAKLFIWKILSIWYSILLRLFHPVYKPKKYKISICAIFRDEGLYLREWLEFHILIGVEHFYLYNNFSEDNYFEVLAPYIEKGVVSLKEWPYQYSQMEAYADCIQNYKDESNWIGFIDLDEFVVPKNKKTLHEILGHFKDRPAVIFQWKYFGSSGLLKRDIRGLVTEDFNVCWPKLASIGKLFFNTGYDYWQEKKQYMHERWSKYKGIRLPSVNIFDKPAFWGFNAIKSNSVAVQINHYLLKSYEEYMDKKSKRGGGIHANMHDKEYFFYHERLCVDTDYAISKYTEKLKRKMLQEANPL